MKIKKTHIAITATEKEWKDLIQFIVGDLHNMEESEIKDEMNIFLDKVRLGLAKYNSPPQGMPEICIYA